MMNIVDAYNRVLRAVEVHNVESVAQNDWEIYKMLTELEDA